MNHKKNQHSYKLMLFLITTIMGVLVCACSSEESTTMSTQNSASPFTIYILSANYNSLGLSPDYKSTWAKLQQVYKTGIAVSINVDDIQTYDWTNQIITLTPEKSKNLIATMFQTANEQQDPSQALLGRAFVVELKGNAIYGGIFHFHPSAMAINFPVIYSVYDGEKFSLTLRPVHTFLGYDTFEPEWYGIKNSAIKDIFSEAGKLKK